METSEQAPGEIVSRRASLHDRQGSFPFLEKFLVSFLLRSDTFGQLCLSFHGGPEHARTTRPDFVGFRQVRHCSGRDARARSERWAHRAGIYRESHSYPSVGIQHLEEAESVKTRPAEEPRFWLADARRPRRPCDSLPPTTT